MLVDTPSSSQTGVCACGSPFIIPSHNYPYSKSKSFTESQFDPERYDNQDMSNSAKRTDTVHGLVYEGDKIFSKGNLSVLTLGKMVGYTKGESKETKTVVLKKLKYRKSSEVDIAKKRFNRELIVWQQLCHPNIAPLLGTWTNVQKPDPIPFLVTEYYNSGNIAQHADKNRTWSGVLENLVRGVHLGICYLHDNGVVHADLRPDNIRIDESGSPRILDFGFSKIADQPGFTTLNETDVSFYKQPEYGTTQERDQVKLEGLGRAKGSKKGDVWAFAMVALRIFSGTEPYSPHKDNIAFRSNWLKEGSPPPYGRRRQVPVKLWEILFPCWILDLELRPDISSIVIPVLSS